MPTAEYQRRALVQWLAHQPKDLQRLVASHYCRRTGCITDLLLAEVARLMVQP